jgi:tRNA-uridine 2-sulfurtransferase
MRPTIPNRIAVAMSGGVDSSAAAALLKNRGHEVFGLTMQIAEGVNRCCSPAEIRDAREVCGRLGIHHYVIPLVETFQREVIAGFVSEYEKGRTPNPCAVCNPTVKFGALLDKAVELGAAKLATGHYAGLSTERRTGRIRLLRGKDRSKDQSYFLARLSQNQLSKILFPVGGFAKTEIRRLAETHGLPVAAKKDSQEACFIPPEGVSAFIAAASRKRFEPGPIVDESGRELGRHNGLIGYTIGQRKGLGIATGTPVYVIRIEPENNRLVVGPDESLRARSLIASSPNWISIASLTEPMRVRTRIRYAHAPVRSLIVPRADGTVEVRFDSPQRAVTPGQLAVFYDRDRVVGSAWIDQATP